MAKFITNDLMCNEEIFLQIKAQFVKKCMLDVLHQFINVSTLPPELTGFIIHLESEIVNADISICSGDNLLLWFEQKIALIQQRERLYPHWNSCIEANKKMSFVLNRLKSRLFFIPNPSQVQSEESQEIEAIITAAKHDFKNKVEKQIINEVMTRILNDYQASCFLPIGEVRNLQQQELLAQIMQAANAYQAIDLLQEGMLTIQQHHIGHSFAANWPLYQRKSRLAARLQNALHQISEKIPLDAQQQKTMVEKTVEYAIEKYLEGDLFYHNRQRRLLAYQLLNQLRTDRLCFTSDQIIQKKYKMRSTIEQFIKKADHEFKHTYFFSRFYITKRSRLAVHLESIKEDLINNNYLSALELEADVKQPILQTVRHLANDDQIDADMMRDINSLINTISNAHSSEAIEAILEGHIRSLLQLTQQTDLLTSLKHLFSGNIYFKLAIQLESALLEWQANGILPAASGYKTFLETLGADRQTHENELQRLEQKFHIKIPRNPKLMHDENETVQSKASRLFKRICSL